MLVLFIGACTEPARTSGGADAAVDQLVERAAHAAALSRAAETGSAAEIARLIEAGADVTMQDGDGVTPLHLAARFNPDPSVVGVLLDAGAEVNSRSEDGATPLHEFVTNSSAAETIELLLAMGADPNAVDDRGRTPLDVANEEYHLVLRRAMAIPESD